MKSNFTLSQKHLLNVFNFIFIFTYFYLLTFLIWVELHLFYRRSRLQSRILLRERDSFEIHCSCSRVDHQIRSFDYCYQKRCVFRSSCSYLAISLITYLRKMSLRKSFRLFLSFSCLQSLWHQLVGPSTTKCCYLPYRCPSSTLVILRRAESVCRLILLLSFLSFSPLYLVQIGANLITLEAFFYHAQMEKT